MIELQALRVACALTGRARQLLDRLQDYGLVVLDRAEAKEFAAELIDIARAIMISAGDDDDADTGAEVIDLGMRLRVLDRPSGGDAA